MWCPQCGAEYRDGVTTCTDCGVALVDEQPEDGGADQARDTDESEVVVYELEEWGEERRGALELRLNAEGIEHQWEAPTGADVKEGYEPGNPWAVGTDLVVGEQDEETVDALLDEIEFPDAIEGVTAAEGEDDEDDYDAMGKLYDAADRLKNDPSDLAVAGDFFDAADAAKEMEPPFGIDPDVWRRVQDLAAQIAAGLEQEVDEESVAALAQQLRNLLFDFV